MNNTNNCNDQTSGIQEDGNPEECRELLQPLPIPQDQKKKCLIFVDYEHLFWGFWNAYDKSVPDIAKIVDDIKQNYKIQSIYFFADFSKEHIEAERNRLRAITADIIDCSNPLTEKDFTDFIMLDYIYRSVHLHESVETYIIMTGDGHFHNAVAFLKTNLNKEVGIYGVKGGISRQLKMGASYTKELEPNISLTDNEILLHLIDALNYQKPSQNNFNFNDTRFEDRRHITFTSTIAVVQIFNKSEFSTHGDRYKTLLSQLIKNGYVHQTVENIPNKGNVQVINPVWADLERLEKDIKSR